jgi:serine/threonine-protein kinase RsbW
MKTVSTVDLVARIAGELGVPEADARAVLDRALADIREELQSGNSVVLPQFLTIQVKPGETLAATTQAGGKLDLPAARQLQVELDDALRAAIEGPKRYQILLVVPKKDAEADAMAAQLASPRTAVDVVAGETEGCKYLERKWPDLVVLESGLGPLNGLCEALKTKAAAALTSVIQVCADSNRPEPVKRLTVLPDESIREPYELADLFRLIETELARATEWRRLAKQAFRFRLPTRSDCLEQANDLLDRMLRATALGEEARDSLAVACREALDNAAWHGNSNNEKTHIEVQFAADPEKITVSVADEGNGFDTEFYLTRGLNGVPAFAARERNHSGFRGGLGIMLMLRCADQLEYNCTGNKVTLTRYIHSHGQP